MAEDQINQTKQKPAKKKTSPLKIALIILVLLIALIILKFILIIIASPTISVDYLAKYSEITRPANYDPNENAAPYYERAFEVFWDLPYVAERYQIIWPNDMNDNEIQTVKKWLDLNTQALSYLEQATSKPYYWVRRESAWYSQGMLDLVMDSSHPNKFLQASHFLNSQITVMMNQGNIDDVLKHIIQLHKIGGHLLGLKMLGEQLVGRHIKDISVNTVFEILDRQAIDKTILKEWQEKLERQIDESRKELDFRSEKYLAYDIIQRIFTDNGRGNGRLIPRKALQLIEPAIISLISPTETEVEQIHRDRYFKFIWLALFGPDRKETEAIVDKYFAYVETLKNQTPWQLKSKDIKSDDDIQKMCKGNFIEEAVPSVYGLIELYQRHKAKESALITTISILRYKEDKGQLPENLDQLVSTEYLNELPMDPYSDGSLVYRRIGDYFMIYSLGADFDDDGGVYSEWGKYSQGGDKVFWPVEKSKENAIK